MMQRKHFFLAVFFFITGHLYAQVELEKGLLFSDFTEGTAVLKNGSIINAQFNYNTVDEEMLFKDPEGTILALGNPSYFVVINVRGRIFEYAGKDAFYERVSLDDSHFLYIQRKSTVISEGKDAPYGGKSQTSSVTTLSSLKGTGGNYARLSAGESFKAEVESFYYLKIKNKLKRFNNVKMLSKLFDKDCRKEIEQFAVRENIDFSIPENVVRIVEYAYSL